MTERDIHAWLNAFKSAWHTQNPMFFASLFAAGSEYRDTPFSVPIAYNTFEQFWFNLAQEQQDNDMVFAKVELLAGNRAIAFWRAFTTRKASFQRMEGDGVMLLTFNEAGLCSDLREWQHARLAGSPLVKRDFGGA